MEIKIWVYPEKFLQNLKINQRVFLNSFINDLYQHCQRGNLPTPHGKKINKKILF